MGQVGLHIVCKQDIHVRVLIFIKPTTV